MKLIFNNLDTAHAVLSRDGDRDPGDDWKNEQSEGPELRGARFDNSPLPNPLHYAGMTLVRRNQTYDAQFFLAARKPQVMKRPSFLKAREPIPFDELSGRLVTEFEKTGRVFYPTYKNGTGVIYGKAGSQDFSFHDANNDMMRILSMGTSNCRIRKFNALESFERDMEEFRTVAEIYLNTCVAMLIESGQISPKLPEKFDVFMNL